MSRVKDLQKYVHKVLKDADVIHHSLGDPTKEEKEKELERYEKLSAEFGFVV